MSRTKEDLIRMQGEDTAVGLACYYLPMEKFIKERNYKRIVEVGTAYGGLANHLLSTCEIELFITIDPYKFYPDMPGLFDQDDYDMLKYQTADRLKKYEVCHMVFMNSKEGYDWVKDDYKVDAVFLDGLHTYDMVKWEIEHYSKLIRPGGALIGHDYDTFKEVKRAVDEYCKPIMLETNLWLKEL